MMMGRAKGDDSGSHPRHIITTTTMNQSAYAPPSSSLLARRRPRELTEEQKAEVREAFEIFDMDKDGALDFHEFKVGRRGRVCAYTIYLWVGTI